MALEFLVLKRFEPPRMKPLPGIVFGVGCLGMAVLMGWGAVAIFTALPAPPAAGTNGPFEDGGDAFVALVAFALFPAGVFLAIYGLLLIAAHLATAMDRTIR